MRTEEIIRMVECEGSQMAASNKKLKISQGERLPPSLVAQIKENKEKILSVLQRDHEARGIGLLTAIHGTLYTVSINRNSDLYMEDMGGYWELRRETFTKGRPQATFVRVMAKGYFRDVLYRARGYMSYLKGVRR